MRYPITVDGHELDTWAYGITSRNGWQSTPGLRAASVEAAHVDGVLVPDRAAPLEPGKLALSMHVRGSDWPEYVSNLDTLKRLFSTPRGTVEVTMDTGEVTRVCQARVVASWQPSHVNPVHSTFTVLMEIPSGTWTTAEYYTRAATNVSVIDPIYVVCDEPTAQITDAQLLILNPGIGVEWTVWDATVDSVEQQRISVTLTVPGVIPAGRSILINIGQWTASVISRPDLADVDGDWFSQSHLVLEDVTALLERRGPMAGRSLLPLQPGAGPMPPRIPGLRLDTLDYDGIPNVTPAVVCAVRPSWL